MKTSQHHPLVIGGAGYIGSHMVEFFLSRGVTPVVFDNLSTGFRHFVPSGVPFVQGDLTDREALRRVFKQYKIQTVLHFASFIIVPESVSDPVKYYKNNVSGFINLLAVMKEFAVKRIVFSSTAAVYGEPRRVPIRETDALKPQSPYGRSKLMCEQILRDAAAADPSLCYTVMRYFNVAGASDSGRVGENHEPETHLIPIVLQTAAGLRKALHVFGADYPTKDKTCVRDYIHVQDLCEAHFLAVKHLSGKARNQIFNLGSQKGYSVREVIDRAQAVTEKTIKVKVCARRPGDPARLVASFDKARKVLGWQPRRDLTQMISSAWRWQLRALRKVRHSR